MLGHGRSDRFDQWTLFIFMMLAPVVMWMLLRTVGEW